MPSADMAAIFHDIAARPPRHFSVLSDRQEAYFLETLWSGMDHLAVTVGKIEYEKFQEQQRWIKDSGMTMLSVGGSSFGNDPYSWYITNSFIWYAVSSTNFLSLFAVCLGQKKAAFRPKFSAMWKWRDKVAAHTAYVAPRNDDNNLSRDASLVMPPDWDNDHYSVGRWFVGNDAGQSSHRDWGWALTSTHREMCAFVETALVQIK